MGARKVRRDESEQKCQLSKTVRWGKNGKEPLAVNVRESIIQVSESKFCACGDLAVTLEMLGEKGKRKTGWPLGGVKRR